MSVALPSPVEPTATTRLALLAIETSTHLLSVGVLSRSLPANLLLTQGEGGAQASANLLPTITGLLAQADMTLADLDAVVYGCGPGAFTGLRTATAVVQGLAYGTRSAHHPDGLPVLGVDTLLATAEAARHALQTQQGLPEGPLIITAMLDARMDELYAATWQFDDPTAPHAHQVAGPWLCKPEALAAQLPPQALSGWLAGNVFEVYGQRLPALAPLGLTASGQQSATPSVRHIACWPDAAALLRLAPGLLTAGHATAAAGAQPVYVRDQVAKTTAERAAEQAAAHGAAQAAVTDRSA